MKHRSSFNFATQYAGFKQGYAIGIENAVFLKEEAVAGTFNPPAIPTQGKSEGAVGAVEDISAVTGTKFRISVDGGAVVEVTLVPSAGTTAADIVAEVESKTNAALAAAGQDGRVWVETTGSLASRQYIVYSQKCGASSSVVITDAEVTNDNIADDLALGVANGGTESAGTNATDFLYMTKASLKVAQEFERSKHRLGRQAASFIKKKKMVDGDVELYVNFDTAGGTPSIDPAVALLLEAVFGRKTVSANEIAFDMGNPQTKYMSAVQVNNTFARMVNGLYAKTFTLTLPGDGEASIKIPLKGRDAKECSIAKIGSAVDNSATIPVGTGEAGRYEAESRVMVIDPDGRTVVAGASGTLAVNSVDKVSDNVVLSAPVTVAQNGYLVPWSPVVFGFSGLDNPVTGLQGSVSFDNGANTIEEIRSVEITVDPKLEDLDGYYGADGNRGFIVGDVADINVKIELNLSASQYQKLISTKNFDSFPVKIILGASSGRHLEISLPKVVFKVPAVELPDAGSVPVSFEGMAFQSAVGSYDAIKLSFK